VHSKLLIDTCANNNLRIATLHDCCDIDFTYNFCMKNVSFIDHFIVSTATYDTSNAGCIVRHDSDNLSDHDSIMLTLDIDWSSIDLTERHAAAKAAWGKASTHNFTKYKHMPQEKLISVLPSSESLTRRDLMCCNEQHAAQLNHYCNQIIQACVDSAASTIPTTTHTNNCTKRYLDGMNMSYLYVKNQYYGIIYG
jgi:hypothetical protein